MPMLKKMSMRKGGMGITMTARIRTRPMAIARSEFLVSRSKNALIQSESSVFKTINVRQDLGDGLIQGAGDILVDLDGLEQSPGKRDVFDQRDAGIGSDLLDSLGDQIRALGHDLGGHHRVAIVND